MFIGKNAVSNLVTLLMIRAKFVKCSVLQQTSAINANVISRFKCLMYLYMCLNAKVAIGQENKIV